MSMIFKTYRPARQDVNHNWFVVDAQDKILGRFSSRVAMILRGKHKPSWCLDVDQGDFEIVLNAGGIHVTGRKSELKMVTWHSGYPGGHKQRQFKTMLAHNPIRVIEKAVHHMLPKNKLGMKQRHRLFVYTGNEHPHEAQQPKVLSL